MRSLPSLRSIGAGLCVALALIAASERASGYCRSTTCSGDCPRDEQGCKTTGEPLFWASRCVGFSVQRDGTENLAMEEVRSVIEGAFLAWTELPCDAGPASIAFSPQDDVACRRAEYDGAGPNANVVLFQDTKWDYAGVDNNLAKTTVTYDTGTGEIFDADIELNFAFNELTVGDAHVVYDIGSILTHEIGHFVGLDHTPDPIATMFAGYEVGTIEQRTLELDDVAGICAAYPPEREAACDPEPKNGLGDACSGDDVEDAGSCAAASPGPDRGVAALPAVAVIAGIGLVRRARRRTFWKRAERSK